MKHSFETPKNLDLYYLDYIFVDSYGVFFGTFYTNFILYLGHVLLHTYVTLQPLPHEKRCALVMSVSESTVLWLPTRPNDYIQLCEQSN